MNNIHGTALLAGDRGILILGSSGSGKTTLALALVDHMRRRGLFSRLVGDDQLFVTAGNGRLVCSAPPAIAGLVEIPGLGPHPAPFEARAVIDLVMRLVPADEMPRFQEDGEARIAGCAVPMIHAARRNANAALLIVASRLAAVGLC